jgi:hypothetical protein
VALALIGLAALGAGTAAAKKTHLFLGFLGSAAEQKFSGGAATAVDQQTGDVLVVDADAKTLSRFKPNGEPDPFSGLGTNVIDGKAAEGKTCAEDLRSCDETPQHELSFHAFPGEDEVAIDESGGIAGGDIYLTQHKSHLVDVFSAAGKYLGQLTAADGASFSATLSPCGVAVDESGGLYVSGGLDGNIYKYVPTANPPLNSDAVATFSSVVNPCNLAAGRGASAGHLFVTSFFNNLNATEGDSVAKLDSTTGALQSIVEPGEGRLVATDPGSGHLFVSAVEGTTRSIREYDASGPSPVLLSAFQTEVGSIQGLAVDGGSGRIYAAISNRVVIFGPLVTVPEPTTGSAQVTGDHEATLGGTVNPDGLKLEECLFEYGLTIGYGLKAPCAETPAEIGLTTKQVHADLTELEGEARYHYRLVARNENTTIYGEDATFKMPSKPVVESGWASGVGSVTATLNAAINPEGSATTYRFEWGTDTSYGNLTPSAPAGEGAGVKAVNSTLSGLQPNTTYHFRVLATNGIGSSEGDDVAFTTYAASNQPPGDCANESARLRSSRRLADCRAYELVSPIDKGGNDISVLNSNLKYPAALDQPSTDGDRFTYSNQTAFGDALSSPYVSQYVATRTGTAWVSHDISPIRDSGSVTTFPTSRLDVQYRYFSPDLCSGWLFQDSEPTLAPGGVPGYFNLYRRDLCGEAGYEAITTTTPAGSSPQEYWPGFKGLSADGKTTFFNANAKLTANALETSDLQVYEARGGEVRLASILPSAQGSKPAAPAVVGAGEPVTSEEGRQAMVDRAISADGSRVFWTAGVTTGPLYVRINGEKTLLITSAVSRFWTAAVDGSKVFFTTGSELLEAAVTSTKVTKATIAKEIDGVVGASEDGSRLYFVSKEAIDGGEAGRPNLYLDREGTILYVATLDALDVKRELPFAIDSERPANVTSRVSPDGNAVAFMSAARLTGFDNSVADGERAMEVYLYDAQSSQLTCVSCNPAGVRPLTRTVSRGENAPTVQVASQLPPWENNLHAPHVLSDNGGRLFFESYDALLPRDSNGTGDVYEWERPGVGNCTMEAADYFSSSGGCLSLVSTGQQIEDAELIDATPTGADVFIRTGASLVSQDPGLIDIYDAREGGGLPESPPPVPACEGEACQSPSSPPSAQVPSSSSFQGEGNIPPSARKTCRKGRVLRKGKCVKQRTRAKRHGKRRAGR